MAKESALTAMAAPRTRRNPFILTSTDLVELHAQD
jgi:hypothetical protein